MRESAAANKNMISDSSYFYESPPAAIESIHSVEQQIIINYGLSTPEGRSLFLEKKLRPLIADVDRLNTDIQSLSQTIADKNNNCSEDQKEILLLTELLNTKLKTMSSLLTILEMTSSISNKSS